MHPTELKIYKGELYYTTHPDEEGVHYWSNSSRDLWERIPEMYWVAQGVTAVKNLSLVLEDPITINPTITIEKKHNDPLWVSMVKVLIEIDQKLKVVWIEAKCLQNTK
jgi:hypothetical protein